MSYVNRNIEICEIGFDDNNWDSIVDKLRGYVFYRRDYLSAFTRLNSYIPVLFFAKSNDGCAACVFWKRDIATDSHFNNILPKQSYYDLISPYGYGGYVGDFNDKNLLMQRHFDFCKQMGYVSEVVKFHPLSDIIGSYNGDLETNFHNVVRDLKMSLQDIWMDYRSKVRKNVKRAQENGLSVIVDEKGAYIDEFLKIYYSTMDRNGASHEYYFSKDYFSALCAMNKAMCYFHTVYKDKIISTELVLYDDYYCYSFLGGTDSAYYPLRPNDLLKYEIIQWGRMLGLSFFVLGGGHGKDDGIFEYKKTFAPHGIVNFYVGTNIFLKEKYDYLCGIRKSIDNTFVEETKLKPAYRY